MSTLNLNVDFIVTQLGGDVGAAGYFNISRQAVAKWRKTQKLPRMVYIYLKETKPDLLHEAIKLNGDSGN